MRAAFAIRGTGDGADERTSGRRRHIEAVERDGNGLTGEAIADVMRRRCNLHSYLLVLFAGESVEDCREIG